MVLSELQVAVYALTKRPDKVAETIQAIQNAILKLHTQDFYPKDIIETGVSFGTASILQDFDKSIFPRWRAVSYIQPVDGTSFDISGDQLVEITPKFSVDDYDVFKNNVYYEAGQYLKLRTSPAFQYFIVGYYALPDISTITNPTLVDWVPALYPFAVVYEAAAIIFKSIGFVDQEKSMRELAAGEAGRLGISSILATGS